MIIVYHQNNMFHHGWLTIFDLLSLLLLSPRLKVSIRYENKNKAFDRIHETSGLVCVCGVCVCVCFIILYSSFDPHWNTCEEKTFFFFPNKPYTDFSDSENNKSPNNNVLDSSSNFNSNILNTLNTLNENEIYYSFFQMRHIQIPILITKIQS